MPTTLERLETNGSIVPDCGGCKPWYETDDPQYVFAPRHKASSGCESGRRPHCSCSTCF